MSYKVIPQLTAKQLNRFWSRIDQKTSDGCHEWKGRASDGRGKVKIGDKNISYLVSRVAYALVFKADISNYCVCHTCDNPLCCNPNHLFLGTIQDNLQDKALKGRVSTKITPEIAREIREYRAKGLS